MMSASMPPLVIIGGGGFAKQVLGSYGDIARTGSAAPLLGIVDDDASKAGTTVLGYSIMGDLSWLLRRGLSGIRCVVAVSDPRSRAAIVARLDEGGAAYSNLIHPSAVVWGEVAPASGIVVQPYALVSVGARVGSHVHLNEGATVNHDSQVAAFVTVGPHADVNGRCNVCEGAFIGCQSALHQGVTIGAWATVGMCACVLEDVPPGVTVVGVPARPVRV
ncbi:MAG: NeuD/PglB/VioB family sugar acetyltransferase [Dehalococcoidia bacterium]|nr:NeuD/PglB/VioB family sugar acetyltransferase [Dehalococcoidia bacterium]